jgi:chromosome segregation ATPase
MTQQKEKIKQSEQEKNDQISSLEDRVTELRAQNKEFCTELEQVQLTNKELSHQKVMLNEEITKVETQLEFIKDIVIREKAF